MISIYEPNIKKYCASAIDAIKSGWISNHGVYIEKATNLLQNILNVKHVILMANGTVATHCLFIGLKFKYPNIKKIYVPNNCYVAAWNSVMAEYPREIISVMKMDADTWNIDVNYIHDLELNSAVLIVHNLGNIINVPELKKRRPDLIFIEDNCEGAFGKYNDVYTGSSDATLCTSVSFYGNKIITTGEGGAFMTNDDELYTYIKKVYSQGMSNERYVHDTYAYNYRMTNIEAAFLFEQLLDLNTILENKRKIFDNYTMLLQDLNNNINNKIKLFVQENNTLYAPWIFALRIVNNPKTISETINYFKDNNVDIRPFFYPIEKHKHLNDIEYDYDVVSQILNREIIMIPSSPDISFEDQQYVVSIIDKFIKLISI